LVRALASSCAGSVQFGYRLTVPHAERGAAACRPCVALAWAVPPGRRPAALSRIAASPVGPRTVRQVIRSVRVLPLALLGVLVAQQVTY
jgi:hypothetical protein